MKTYHAPHIIKYLHTFIGIAILMVFTLVMYKIILKGNPSVQFGLIIAWVIAIPISVALINKFPNLKVDDDNLYVQYFAWYIKVPWEDVKTVKKPMQGDAEKIVIIETLKLPLPYRLLGLIYNELSMKPVILLSVWTEDFDELLNKIKEKTST